MRPNSSRPNVPRWLAALTSARAGPTLLGVALLVGYVALPLLVAIFLEVAPSFVTLAAVSTVSVVALAVGAHTPFFDPLFSGRLPRVRIDTGLFNAALWGGFVVFVLLAWTTATEIPLVAALRGGDPETVAVLREQFLKAREGWQASFVYINAILSGALIPYSLAIMFLNGMRWRWLAASFFLVFCVSFVEKAFFFKAALPLLYLVVQGHAKTRLSPRTVLFAAFVLLLTVTSFSGSGSSDNASGDTFFSVSYAPQGAIQHLIWRSVAIPLISAADAISVFQEQFGGQILGGATSCQRRFKTDTDFLRAAI